MGEMLAIFLRLTLDSFNKHSVQKHFGLSTLILSNNHFAAILLCDKSPTASGGMFPFFSLSQIT